MAHFAQIDENNIVTQVIVVKNDVLLDNEGIEQEQLGVDFCRNLFGGDWKQCSYNGSFRKNFAAASYIYDAARDAFIEPRLFQSWSLDEQTCQWQPPTPKPEGGYGFHYTWNEGSLVWDKVEIDYSAIE